MLSRFLLAGSMALWAMAAHAQLPAPPLSPADTPAAPQAVPVTSAPAADASAPAVTAKSNVPNPPGHLVLAPLDGETAKPSAEAPAKPTEPPQPLRSILMPQDAVDEIHMASDIFGKYSSGRQQDLTPDEQAFLSQITGLAGGQPIAKRETKRYAYPQWFLEELNYHSPSDWLVQISGHKITQDTPQDKATVKVVGVDKDAIKLQWIPLALDKFTDHIPDPPDPNVVIDKDKGEILVTLRPHQTFTTYAMRVVEGKVVPKIITAEVGEFPDGQEVGGGEPGEKKREAAAPRPQKVKGRRKGRAAAGDGDEDDNEGVNGLISQYQRKGGKKR